MCRLCENYFSLDKLNTHLVDCERSQQIKYQERKLEEKGGEIMEVIHKNGGGDEERRSRMEGYLERMFYWFDEKTATFRLKQDEQEREDILTDFKMDNIPTFKSLMDILENYHQLKREVAVKSASDQDSKRVIKSKRKIVSIRGIGNSSTSLDPEGFTVRASSHS